jgi:GNAT superfamily N-acetyltransferase
VVVPDDDDDRVVGDLLGCRDTTAVELPPRAVARHLIGRGLLVRPGTAPVLWRTLGDAAVATARRRMPPAQVVDERWPAHLHIDLLPEARGTGVGRRLVDGWLASLRAEEVPGCHLVTWAENGGAIAFFEAVGFVRHGDPQPMLGLRSPTGDRHHTQLMVQRL